MFDVVVGDLRLDIWTNGQGVVSRRRRRGEPRRSRVPVDPEGFNPQPALRAFAIGCLAASAIACAGAVALVRAGSVPLAMGLFVLAAVLAAFGGVYVGGWAFARRHGRYVVLDREAAVEFKAIAEARRRALGRRPRQDDTDGAADRLWELARNLADTGGVPVTEANG